MDDLTKYRLESAKDRLMSAKVLLESGQYKDSIGRSYYAIFTAIRAVLAARQVDFSKHAGVIAYFQKEYIKTGIFEKNIPSIFSRHFRLEIAVIMMIFLLFPSRMQGSNMTEQ